MERAASAVAAARAPDTGPAPPLLAVHELHCTLGGREVLRGVSLTLHRGELGCLLGPSGCGKTTLLRHVAGFHAARRGRIDLRGIDVCSPHSHVPPERRGLGFVFQDLALFPHLSVGDNVAFGLHAMVPAQRAPRVQETLALLGLHELAARYPHELSGGQQQRVALARSLAPRPDLLLLDEPFSSLDAHLRTSLRDELRALLKRLGTAALLVTHDQDEAFAFGDRVGVMQAGRIEQWAAGFDIYHRPATRFVARFVGDGRFLRARVEPGNRVRTALGLHQAAAALQLAEGTPVDVLIRPDDVQPAGRGEGIEAEVRAAVFRGAETHYLLRLADGEDIGALFPSHRRHAVGDRVRIGLDLEHVVVFSSEGANPATDV